MPYNLPNRKLQKAMVAYITHVEYGYAPEKKKDCKKAGLLGKKDKYWIDEQETVRQQKNLIRIETLDQKEIKKKKKLRENMVKELENELKKRSTDPKYNKPYNLRPTTEGTHLSILAYVNYGLQNSSTEDNYIFNKRKKDILKIPYYCTNSKKGETVYSKIGDYESYTLAGRTGEPLFAESLRRLEAFYVLDIENKNLKDKL